VSDVLSPRFTKQGAKQAESKLIRRCLDGLTAQRSYSRLLAFEAARILFRLGCDVRVYNPTGLPVKDDVQHLHPKVQELRSLSKWSDGNIWVSPEQHGNLVSGCLAPMCSTLTGALLYTSFAIEVSAVILTLMPDCSLQEPD
jgi:hypothetical protein